MFHYKNIHLMKKKGTGEKRSEYDMKHFENEIKLHII